MLTRGHAWSVIAVAIPIAIVFAPQVTHATKVQYDTQDRPGVRLYADDSAESTNHANPEPTTSAITRYDYLPTSELATIVDAEGNVTRLSYDLRGLRTQLDNPDTGKLEERYDLMGNRVALVEPNHRANGTEVRYLYDRDRLVRVDYPSKPDVVFEYGAPGAAHGRAGRLAKVTDESGSQEHFYGALGEVTRTIRVVAPVQPNQPSTTFDLKTVTDSLGRQLRVVYPDGVAVTNEFDADGMLRAVRGAGTGWQRTYVEDLRYDEFGHRIRARYGNGAVSQWSFDPKRQRLASVVTTAAGGRIQDLHYTYDAASNPERIENRLAQLTGGSGTMPGRSHLDLTYDGVDRLKTASGTAELSAQKTTRYQQTFSYSPSHNLIHKQRVHLVDQPSGIPAAPTATNFSSAYAYTSERPHLATQIGELLVTYDPSGNPTRRRKQGSNVEQVLVWDDDNRMVSVSGSGVNQRNTYDAAGNRVRRRGVQSETVYANPYFDVENGTQGVRHVFAGGLRVASELTRFSSGTDPVATKPGTAYFHQDHLQSTSVLTTETGAVHESLEYFVDGETWINRGPQKP